MKKIFIKIIQKLFSNPKLFLKFKDVALTNPSEHLFRTIDYIKKQVPDPAGNCIVDIGAAGGDTCVFFRRMFPELAVIGFEPVLKSFEEAKKKTTSLRDIQIHRIALGKSEGETEIHVLADSLSSSLNQVNRSTLSHETGKHAKKFIEVETQKVRMARLDDVLPNNQPVLLMKLDTQGTELDVLKGAVNTLKRTRLILAEMNNHKLYENTCQYYEIDGFLRGNGFILKDIYVTYRAGGELKEFDALYENAHQ